jgi:hypothetical protein
MCADHETPAVARGPRWSEMVSVVAIDPTEQPKADTVSLILENLLERRIKEWFSAVHSWVDDVMFWEPARDALDNGGCRQ